MIDVTSPSDTTGSQLTHPTIYKSPYAYEIKETQKSSSITLKEENEDIFEYRDSKKDLSKKILDNKTNSDNEYSHSYTISYIQHNTNTFLNRVYFSVNEWATAGTESSMASIAELRKIKEIYRQYLHQDPIGRILHSTLALMFEDNKWELIEINKVQKLSHILKSLINSDKSEDNVRNFVRELVRAKIDFTST